MIVTYVGLQGHGADDNKPVSYKNACLWLGGSVSLCMLIVGAVFLAKNQASTCPTPPSYTFASTWQVTSYMLGETEVNITVESRTGPLANINFLNVHENENTSVVAVRTMQYYYGGSLTRIQHGGERYVKFMLDEVEYKFDPNRIFTPNGIEATLTLNGPYSSAAATAVAGFAAELLQVFQFDAQPLVFCLHNNGPGYSAADYLPNATFASDAAAVYITPWYSPHDFFFVTTQALYNTVVGMEFNCVLQNPLTATDDGSLSYYAFQQNIPYVNIEAMAEAGSEGNQVLTQLNMVQSLMSTLYLN